MTTDTLPAAVARLRKWLSTDEPIKMEKDLCTVLAALESAQANAARYRWLRGGAPGHSGFSD